MGYCYGRNDRGHMVLACDQCGNVGQVRKRKCPYGWCPAAAVCPRCWANPELRARIKAYHETDCEQNSAEHAAMEAHKQAVLAAGGLVRVSASGDWKEGVPKGQVEVLFRGQRGGATYHMAPGTYEAISLLEVATPDDYRAHGEVVLVALKVKDLSRA